jgi:hypothetical protein
MSKVGFEKVNVFLKKIQIHYYDQNFNIKFKLFLIKILIKTVFFYKMVCFRDLQMIKKMIIYDKKMIICYKKKEYIVKIWNVFFRYGIFINSHEKKFINYIL